MFLKTGELKKMMKAALKGAGLFVGTIDGSNIVQADSWGLQTDIVCAPNKFQAAVVELIGDFPEQGKYYRYWNQDGGVAQESNWDLPDLYKSWKLATDFATATPLTVSSFPYEYQVYQINSDKRYIWARRDRTTDIISYREIDSSVEQMPERPSYRGGDLYWKNDTTIYYVHRETASEKVENALFQALGEMDFFQKDWVPETIAAAVAAAGDPDPAIMEEANNVFGVDEDMQIPY